jgi:hypothetical protein
MNAHREAVSFFRSSMPNSGIRLSAKGPPLSQPRPSAWVTVTDEMPRAESPTYHPVGGSSGLQATE